MIAYRVETWAQVYPDCVPLLIEHREEIGEMDMPFDPDLEQIELMDRLGMLQILTARRDGEMIGYCMFALGRNLTSKGILTAEQKMFFLSKSARAGLSFTAVKMYSISMEMLKVRGVHTVYPHHWMRGDSPKLAKLFERMGAHELERVYALKLAK